MALYEYKCADCEERFDVMRPMVAADDPAECPECGSAESRRAISNFASITPGASAVSSNPMMDARIKSGGGGGCCGGAAAASEDPEGLPGLVLKGIEEFNRGDFFECHESLEEAWVDEPCRVRFLYQGILQVGVGFYHHQNGNWRGATGVLRNGIERLREFEPETLGIDVAKLVRESERCLGELEELGRERVREFDTSKVPRVEWVG